MDDNLSKNFIEKAFSDDELSINVLFSRCDLYFHRYRNLVIGIYDYEDFRQIFMIKMLKLIRSSKIAKIKNLNGYVYTMIKNIISELMKKNINCSKNISIDLYIDNTLYLDKEYNFEEEFIKKYEILEIRKIIVSIIGELNDNERDIIKAYYFKNISIADYSRENRLNYYTCAKRLRRTKNKMLKRLTLYSLCRGES